MYEDERYFDAGLTIDGREQAKEAGLLLQGSKLDVVVASPLSRALQTAMIACKAWKSPSQPLLKDPRFVCVEWCREGMTCGVHPCNRRRTISEIKSEYPQFDFSSITSNEDDIWRHDKAETQQDLNHRVALFLEWLETLEAKHVLICSHCVFLHALFADFVKEQHNTANSWFGRGELRSFVFEFQ
uniref:Phosphoglycerate mutase n=1 Tax=Hanusia phi TaxID=3032 RepID=A0A7S0DVM4_9CRYP